ncbi:hypothetical protein HD553DRAFT_347812 [Filobasidium floriforme]|uniref:uncharacterized protein n=1 Tax=Filobasidium floriforme TaxID=5210 RepID=UPI001E8DC5ED|nr:uncharacterized protein HD553DRAFT_347812 [Filobasidium floriforme]KAH8089006.1 hypothetical protein HD553DRAFT_347812 [Filobasidium floriforme]
MSYSDLDAAAFYQAAFTDDNHDNNDTIESPRLPLLKKSPRTRGLDLKMSQQPLMIQVRPLDLRRKGASGGGYQRISMKPSIQSGSIPDSASTKHLSPPIEDEPATSCLTDDPTSSLSLGPQRSPFNTTPLSLSLDAVGQHFLGMTLSSAGHPRLDSYNPPTEKDKDQSFVPISSVKPLRPHRPSFHQTSTSTSTSTSSPLDFRSYSHAFDYCNDDVRPGLSPPITPFATGNESASSSSRMMTPRSMSSPLLPPRRGSDFGPTTTTTTSTGTGTNNPIKPAPISSRTPNLNPNALPIPIPIPTKASETLGALTLDETYLDERPMTPLRAGAKALALLGGLEDLNLNASIGGIGGMGGKKGFIGNRGRKEYSLVGSNSKADSNSKDKGPDTNENQNKFPMYSLKGKNRKVAPAAAPPSTFASPSARPSLDADEKVIGVLPLPRKFDSPLSRSRCPSPDTQSERSFEDQTHARRSAESLLDDVVIVGQDGHRSSGDHDHERSEYEVKMGMVDLNVKSIPRKKIASSDMAFLASDPYARRRDRGPSPVTAQKRRPPPLALTLSNGKTTSMPDRIPQSHQQREHQRQQQQQVRLAPEHIRQNDLVHRLPARISSLPFTPFTRPRTAPAPPKIGRSSSESITRPLFDNDLPVDVSTTSEPNEIVVVQDPHRKGRSFFIEDESPTQGTFGMSLAKKITLKGMGESWKKAVANRV